jgi:hypothetical protein
MAALSFNATLINNGCDGFSLTPGCNVITIKGYDPIVFFKQSNALIDYISKNLSQFHDQFGVYIYYKITISLDDLERNNFSRLQAERFKIYL